MKVGQGPNWGCSVKEKNIKIHFPPTGNKLNTKDQLSNDV
jgi:hypothetical protein